jgi:hypothetical protein
MGSVANKIAKTIAALGRSNVVDLAAWREGREVVQEAGLDDKFLADLLAKGYDPCHAFYIFGQNAISILSEQISRMKEAKGFARIVGAAEDEYMPSYPPISPITSSHFTMWAMFDVQFGSSHETMGTCVLRAAQEFDFPPWLFDLFSLMQQSRMGFYVHCGSDGDAVRLREIGSQEMISCHVPTGYMGQEGQIWFVRLLPPPNALCTQNIAFTTPYVISTFYTEQHFIDYIGREIDRLRTRKSIRADNLHDYLMKYGPGPSYWNEYVFCAYSNHQNDAIFLTGIPDIPETLPHAAH